MQVGFLASESGAVTADWVVLAAALVGLGIVTAVSVQNGAVHMATATATVLQAQTVHLGELGHSN